MRIIGATVMMGRPDYFGEFIQHLREHVQGWVCWNPGVPDEMVKEAKQCGAQIVDDFRVPDERSFVDEEGLVVHSLFTAAREDLKADAVLMLYPTERLLNVELDLGDADAIASRMWRLRGGDDGVRYEPEYTRKIVLARACPHFMWAPLHGAFPFGATKIRYAGDVETTACKTPGTADKMNESGYGNALITADEFDEKGMLLWQQAQR